MQTPSEPNLSKGGGHAFPVSSNSSDWHGMTLRDWFAGQALINTACGANPKNAARHAYECADAMLEARARVTTAKGSE